MSSLARLVSLLVLVGSFAGCKGFYRLAGDDGPREEPHAAYWLAITGTWHGAYQTNLFPADHHGEDATIWINFMDLGNENFTGTMNDGHSGGIDGTSTSHFTGTVDPVNLTFTMHQVSDDPTCPGTFDIKGAIQRGAHSNEALYFTAIDGTNCLGRHTTITGSFN
jgi:hypothetical protein